MELLIRKIKGIRWNHSYRCWYLLLSKESYLLIKQMLPENFMINSNSLKAYLQQRKVVQPLMKKEQLSRKRALILLQFPLSKENLIAFSRFQQLLQLKGYSPNTIKSYSNEFHFLLRLLGSMPISSLTVKHVEAYLLWLIQKEGIPKLTPI